MAAARSASSINVEAGSVGSHSHDASSREAPLLYQSRIAAWIQDSSRQRIDSWYLPHAGNLQRPSAAADKKAATNNGEKTKGEACTASANK